MSDEATGDVALDSLPLAARGGGGGDRKSVV